MSHHHETTRHNQEHKHPNYFGVFIVLAAITALITAIELMAQNGVINLPRVTLNTIYLSFSITKAVLVALWYMHLKFDHYIYSVLFGVPVIFAIVFFTLLLI
jgi:caa(3)-type oxidase subunit IV